MLTYRDQRLIQAFQVIPPYESTPFCGLDALFSIKDINLNNFSELGLTWGCGENGSSVIRLEIMEFAPKNASVIFRHDVEEVSGDEINPKHVAYVLHVIKGKIPQVIGQQLSWIEKTQTWIPTDKLEVLKSDTDQMFVISPLLK